MSDLPIDWHIGRLEALREYLEGNARGILDESLPPVLDELRRLKQVLENIEYYQNCLACEQNHQAVSRVLGWEQQNV